MSNFARAAIKPSSRHARSNTNTHTEDNAVVVKHFQGCEEPALHQLIFSSYSSWPPCPHCYSQNKDNNEWKKKTSGFVAEEFLPSFIYLSFLFMLTQRHAPSPLHPGATEPWQPPLINDTPKSVRVVRKFCTKFPRSFTQWTTNAAHRQRLQPRHCETALPAKVIRLLLTAILMIK